MEAKPLSIVSASKILVVDDELDTRVFLSNLLNASGFIPITAENKIEGFRKAIEEKPSVIILNMMMPDEAGIQMYRNLKRDDQLKHTAVIMLATGAGIASAMGLTRGDVAYMLVIVWAFVGIAVKHAATPLVSIAAWLASALIVVMIIVSARFYKKPVEAQ